MPALIRLGPAGSGGDTLKGIEHVKQIGLQATEVEFTYGVQMKNDLAKKVGELAKKLNISLSVHAPYYVNLGTENKTKLHDSKRRILEACERAHYLGAHNVVFHPGFYEKRDPEKVYPLVLDAMEDLMKTIKEKKWNCTLAPETTGKSGAFGTEDELIKIVKELKCSICIDAAHLFARANGKINYTEVLDKLEVLHMKHLHFHFSGINYTPKGEKNHIVMDNHNPPFEPLAKEILKRKLDVTIISESPITWKDSLKQKKIFEKLGYKFTF